MCSPSAPPPSSPPSPCSHQRGATPAPDSVRLLGVNGDFGDNTWVNNAPTGNGTLAYELPGGNSIRPHLTGYLHLNSAKGLHARMQLRYFDVFGNELTPAKVGGTVTPTDNDHHVWSVDQAQFDDPAVYRVNASTTYESPTGWLTISATNYYI